jgi:predicted PurR-regulated permease PerM
MFFLDVRTAKVVWTIVVCLGALWLLYLLRKPISLFVFALFFAYLILPLVTTVERRLPPRGARPLAIAIVYLVVLGLLVGVALSLGPRLTDEFTKLTQRAPDIAQQFGSGRLVGGVLRQRGWDEARVRQAEDALRAHAGQIVAYVQGAVAATAGWLLGAWVVVLVPVFAFFILKDADQARDAVDTLIEDEGHSALWRDITGDLGTLLGRYVRALILLSLVTFVVWSIVFFAAGVPYPIGLAAIAAVGELIPVVGPITAGAIAAVVALFSGYAHPWLILLFVLAWRGVQDYVTSPIVMRRGVEMHPAVMIFGVIAGGEIAGPVGMFLAVPVIAAVRILWRRLRPGPAPAAGSA